MVPRLCAMATRWNSSRTREATHPRLVVGVLVAGPIAQSQVRCGVSIPQVNTTISLALLAPVEAGITGRLAKCDCAALDHCCARLQLGQSCRIGRGAPALQVACGS